MSNNYYNILGLKNTATDDDIRRAYRTLARRYHPDVNPGVLSSERFKLIAEAYSVLNDEDKRKKYDSELARKNFNSDSAKAFEAYKRNQSQNTDKKTAQERYYEAQKEDYKNLKNIVTRKNNKNESFKNKLTNLLGTSLSFGFNKTKKIPKKIVKPFAVEILETNISLQDAIYGIRKTIELSKDGKRKIKVNIPAITYNGSLIKVRENSTNKNYILHIHIAKHPFLSLEKRGLVLTLPITVREAINGASIKIPTFNGEVLIKVEKDTESGTELRVKSKGLKRDNNVQDDLFVKLIIKAPKYSNDTNLEVATKALEDFYIDNIRAYLPKKLEAI